MYSSAYRILSDSNPLRAVNLHEFKYSMSMDTSSTKKNTKNSKKNFLKFNFNVFSYLNSFLDSLFRIYMMNINLSTGILEITFD